MSVSNLGDLLASSRQERASAENMYQDIFQSLVDMLGDDEADVRAAAAKALGVIGDKKAIDSLKTALKDDEADVRAAAVEALGKIAALMKNNVAIESPKL